MRTRQRATHGKFSKIRQIELPVECQLDLFDKVVMSVLLHNVRYWVII